MTCEELQIFKVLDPSLRSKLYHPYNLDYSVENHNTTITHFLVYTKCVHIQFEVNYINIT